MRFTMGVFCPCVLEFSLNDCTPGELNFNPLCVSVDTGRTLWPACAERRLLYLFNLALSGCCHAAAIRKKYSHSRNMHIINTSFHWTVLFLWLLLFLVLNHLPLPSLIHEVMFLVSVSSMSEDFRSVGWDSFTKCTLYVFSKPRGRPGRSHISSHLTDGLLFVFLFLPHHCSCVFVEISYHYAVL